MNPVYFPFQSVYDASLVSLLSEFLQVPAVNDAVKVPSQFGKGMIVRKELEDGLVIVCWDFSLNVPVTFAKKANAVLPGGRSFIVNYLIIAEGIEVESPLLPVKVILKGGRNVLLLPDDTELDFTVPPGSHAKVLSIALQPGWISTAYADPELGLTGYIQQLLSAPQSPVFMETAGPAEFLMTEELVNAMCSCARYTATVKPRVMTALADFFTRVSAKPITDVTESRILHFTKMQEVAEMLGQHLESALPDLDAIARLFMLSTSTLKRHFKIIFGKGIYEYYLEMKMEYARRLLMETDMPVGHLAYRLNYEKPGSFIDAFKKIYGYSPGTIRKLAS